jgi:hypothetical protein
MLTAVRRRARQLRRRRYTFVAAIGAAAVAGLAAVRFAGSAKPTTLQVGPASDSEATAPPGASAGTGAVGGGTVVKTVTSTTTVTATKVTSTVAGGEKVAASPSKTVLPKPGVTTTSQAGGAPQTSPPKPLPPTVVPGPAKTVSATKETVTPKASTSTTAPKPQAAISTTTTTPGSVLWLKGAGCTPGTAATAGWDGTIVSTTAVGPGGSFALSLPEPNGAAVGNHSATLKCLTPDGSGFATSWTVTVVASMPTVATAATAAIATPDQALGLKGDGFVASSVITIALDGTTLTTSTAAADGTFVVTVHIPSSTPPGLHAITALSADRGAKTTITVMAAQ